MNHPHSIPQEHLPATTPAGDQPVASSSAKKKTKKAKKPAAPAQTPADRHIINVQLPTNNNDDSEPAAKGKPKKKKKKKTKQPGEPPNDPHSEFSLSSTLSTAGIQSPPQTHGGQPDSSETILDFGTILASERDFETISTMLDVGNAEAVQHPKQADLSKYKCKADMADLRPTFASPDTWQELYPQSSIFRPFYFQDQQIPLVKDSIIMFQKPFIEMEWDRNIIPGFAPLPMFARLSTELNAFSSEVKPTSDDSFLRTLALERLKIIIESFYTRERIQICPFGSFASPIANVNSDLDVGIIPANTNGMTMDTGYKSSHKIIESIHPYVFKLAYPGTFEVVRRAKVPLVKYRDRVTMVEIDVSVQWEGTHAVDIIRQISNRYPSFVPVVRTVKAMLAMTELNCSKNGGIHGFCVSSMVAGFLGRLEAMGIQVATITTTKGKFMPENHITGLVFLNFLHFIGYVLDPATTGMDNANGGSLFFRGAECDASYKNQTVLVTSVWTQDPPENVARSITAITWTKFRSLCQFAFSQIYHVAKMEAVVDPCTSDGKSALSKSLLSMIIEMPEVYMNAMDEAERVMHGLAHMYPLRPTHNWYLMVLERETQKLMHQIPQFRTEMVSRNRNTRGNQRYFGSARTSGQGNRGQQRSHDPSRSTKSNDAVSHGAGGTAWEN